MLVKTPVDACSLTEEQLIDAATRHGTKLHLDQKDFLDSLTLSDRVNHGCEDVVGDGAVLDVDDLDWLVLC